MFDDLADASTGAGVVPVLRGPLADLLSLFTTHRHGTAGTWTGRTTQTPALSGVPFRAGQQHCVLRDRFRSRCPRRRTEWFPGHPLRKDHRSAGHGFYGPTGVLRFAVHAVVSSQSQRQPLPSTPFHFQSPSRPQTIGQGARGGLVGGECQGDPIDPHVKESGNGTADTNLPQVPVVT